MISSHCVWPGLVAQVNPRAPECVPCQRAKAHCHVLLQPEHIQVSTNCFSYIHVALVGLLSVSHGFTYLFTVMDCSSCLQEALSLTDTSACPLRRGFVSWQVFPLSYSCCDFLRHGPVLHFFLVCCGVPALGRSSYSDHCLLPPVLWVCQALSLAAQGLLVRLGDWYFHLPWVMFDLWATYKESDSLLLAEMLLDS